MFDIKQNLVLNVGNSSVRLIKQKPLQLRFSGLNPTCAHKENRDYSGFFAFNSRVIATIDNSLNRLDATKRQGETNKRVNNPRSGKLADFTIQLVTWLIVQASYRIEQLSMMNVVKHFEYLMALKGLYKRNTGLYHPCIVNS